jgi:hypothetical protein
MVVVAFPRQSASLRYVSIHIVLAAHHDERDLACSPYDIIIIRLTENHTPVNGGAMPNDVLFVCSSLAPCCPSLVLRFPREPVHTITVTACHGSLMHLSVASGQIMTMTKPLIIPYLTIRTENYAATAIRNAPLARDQSDLAGRTIYPKVQWGNKSNRPPFKMSE